MHDRHLDDDEKSDIAYNQIRKLIEEKHELTWYKRCVKELQDVIHKQKEEPKAGDGEVDEELIKKLWEKHVERGFLQMTIEEARILGKGIMGFAKELLSRQPRQVTSHDLDRIAIKAQAEIGSIDLTTVTAYKAVRIVAKGLGVEVVDDKQKS